MKKHLKPVIFSLLIFIMIISFFKIKKIRPAEIKVEVEARVPEDDVFMVYYLQEGMKALNDQKSSIVRVKGNNKFQKIKFEIPTDLPLETIRIDVGRNTKQRPMEIKYILGFWPNKHTIYPELLPYSMSSQIMGNTSLADQLVDYFKENKIPFIDVRKDLLSSKKDSSLLYHKLDTHWNNRGAFLAYKAFCLKSYATLKLTPYIQSSFKVEEKSLLKGDLTMLLGVDKIIGNQDPSYNYILKDSALSYSIIKNPKGFPSQSIITKNKHCTNRKKVLIFKDSFTTALVQFFSLHYHEIIYVHGALDESMVNRVKPDIVINTRVERYLEFL